MKKLLLIFLLFGSVVRAEGDLIYVIGREAATITGRTIFLSDIAEIRSSIEEDAETVIGLKRVRISDGPEAGKSIELTAAKVLERLRDEGVNLNLIGYRFPRSISVNRAGRKLDNLEVEIAVSELLKNQKSDLSLTKVQFPINTIIPTGNVEITASEHGKGRNGSIPVRLHIKSSDGDRVALNATAQVEEWEVVPVASRPMDKGDLIAAGDIEMARLNLSSLPGDASVDQQSLVGKELLRSIDRGEIFRRKSLSIPPTIEKGANVTMLVRIKNLEASATGTALQTGFIGDEIPIRNNSSKRIVTGRIIEEGLVSVSAGGL